ncbi:response regulator [Leptolyngbya sp. NK1-12]|uniref:Response regulator n=1 Tax=Leptolyngbya sp. NK1-12 TaxID=2547451 RepID=A0AA96WDS8_9CYAN|nr:response regulator [Leptolyngbya sp. NK1-12]
MNCNQNNELPNELPPDLTSDLASDPSPANLQPTANAPALAGLRILLVEDDPSARQLLSDILIIDGGAEVVAVASVREALEILERQQSDVLISNIVLPDGDGRTLIRQIRTLTPEQGGQIPAIAVTAAANERNRTELLAAGFQDYLFKPFDVERLIAAVANLGRPNRDC